VRARIRSRACVPGPEVAGIELVRPEEADRAFVHGVYFSELVKGRFSDETRARLVDIIERMKTHDDVDAIILGGTELPLILREPSYAGVPVLDATDISIVTSISGARHRKGWEPRTIFSPTDVRI
jgi:aspartate racemase